MVMICNNNNNVWNVILIMWNNINNDINVY